MKQRPTNKVGGFMEGKGFYIVLFLCIAAIGISGYYLFSGLMNQPTGFGGESTAAVSGRADLDKPNLDDTAPTAPGKDAETAADAEPTPAQDQPQTPDPEAAASTAYVWPVQGSVERDFSLEVFAYDATMGDWRTHNGVDISAELGAPVSACAAGTVTDVYTDDMMGVTVMVDHGTGIHSIYSNLAEAVDVTIGDAVEAGTVLGSVGTSAIAESADVSHLHFELEEYGVSIDPLNYLH